MLQFGFDPAHRGSEACLAVVALRVAAFGGLADGEALVRRTVGFRTEFQALPRPPAVAGEPRLIASTRPIAGSTRRRPPGDLVVGTKVAVALLAVARLGRRLDRAEAVTYRIIGLAVSGTIAVAGVITVTGFIDRHPHTVLPRALPNGLPINAFARH